MIAKSLLSDYISVMGKNRMEAAEMEEKLHMYAAELGLTVRTLNMLEKRNIFTVNDLLHCTRQELLSIGSFGAGSLEEVYRGLETIGFYRPGQESQPRQAS